MKSCKSHTKYKLVGTDHTGYFEVQLGYHLENILAGVVVAVSIAEMFVVVYSDCMS